jgi:hypothetical protein
MRRALELAADIVLSLWQHDKQHLREKALRPGISVVRIGNRRGNLTLLSWRQRNVRCCNGVSGHLSFLCS